MSQDNDINALRQGTTPLLNAVKENNVLEVRNLLSLGADIEKKHIMGYTPLSWACSYSTEDSHFNTIETLLKNGANVNVANEPDEDTPLHQIIENDSIKTVKLVLDYGPDLKRKNSAGETPLLLAIRSRNFEIVKLILNRGADVNFINPENGFSPLHEAIQLENFNSCKLDLDYQHKVIELLVNQGADVNIINPINGITPLHIACRREDIKIIKLLLRNGANLYEREKEGLTPLKYMLEVNKKYPDKY